MFKKLPKHGLILSLLLFTQLLMVSVSNAQDDGSEPPPVYVNDELILAPVKVSRMGTPPTVPGSGLAFGQAAAITLPEVVDIHTRRDAGSQLIAGLQTSAISELTIDATRLVPAEMESFSLSQDATADDPFDNLNDGATFFTTVSVSSDAVRLVAEVVETTASDIRLFVGQGETPDAASLVCDGGVAAYCNIPYPAEGDWWILVQNRSGTAVSPDSVTLSYGVVPPHDAACSQLWDCLVEFQACLADGSFDECWLELLDCLRQVLGDAALAELQACLITGGGEDCFEELDLEDCFPDWFDWDMVFDEESLLDLADCDDDSDDGCECEGEHQYDNNHEDDHFTHHERCSWSWLYPWLPPNMRVEGPEAVADMEPFDLRVFWDEPAITAGDIWYGAFSVGSQPDHPGDIGTIYVDLHRFDDDVVKQVSAETAVPGDILTYTITIEPNVTPEDPIYTITDTIPVGLTYVPGSATATGGVLDVTGNVLTWTGPTTVPGYSYRVETSDTDPNCSAPSPDADGVADAYLDLAAFGFTPDPIIFGNSVWYQATFPNGEFYLFGSPQGNMLNFTDDGIVFLKDSGPGAAPYNHLPIPNTSDPNNLLAVLWRDMEIIYDGVRGVTLANLVNQEGAIIEYNGVQDRAVPGSNATYDFEVIAYFNAIPDRYEYIFAYNNLSDPVTIGTIGLENADGTEGIQYGYNDLVLSDGMAICFDQIGSGGTAVEINYQVRVNDNAFGILFNEAAHITDNLGSKEAYADVAVRVSDADLFLSGSSDGLAGSIAYADEDIIRYNFDTGDWSLFLDGSDVGLKGTDVDALHLQADGSILLSLSQRIKIPGFGKVDDSDIIRFIPTSLGKDSAGSFEMYFDGSDHGLKRPSEDVDAIGFTKDGRLVISTTGFFKVPRNEKSSFWCWDELDTVTDYSPSFCNRLWGADEDLIVLDSDGSGWEMYFDGSDVLDHRGDLGDVWIDPVTDDIYLSSNEAFTLDSVSGDTLDVFVCHPDSLGSETQCRVDDQLIFDGSEAGLSGRYINGLAISH